MAGTLKSIIEPLEKSASVRSVYGDPVSAQGKTIIPVARVAYGFGGGGGSGVRDDKPGEGEGGGGGVLAMPVGVIEITEEGTRYIPIQDNRKLVAAAILGLCVGIFWARRVS